MKLKSLLSRTNCILTESPFMSILFLSLLMLIGGGNSAKAADVTVDAKTGDLSSINGQENVNITITNRTYQANNWVVVCYPFNVTKSLLDEAFPQGYAVEEYSSMSADGKFTFTVLDLTSKSVPAGTPFLLKSKVEVNSVTFNNVKINTTLNNVTKTNGSYSGTLNGTYSKPAMWQFNSGQSLAGGLFISADGTLTGPYGSPLNDDTDVLRITNGYFSFSEGVSTSLNIEYVTIGGGDNTDDNTDEGGDTGGNSGSGIQMGVKAEITGVWDNTARQIPASAFLSDAQSAILQFVGTNYCLITNTNTDTTVREFQWNDANQMGVTLVLTGDLLQAAKNGYLSIKVNGGSSYKFYVTNFPTETPVREQLTDLPTIYLTVPAAINKNINDVLYKDRSTNEAPYCQATIQVVDNSGSLKEFTDSKLEIKVRGNSTANGMKRPYRLKFGKDDKDPVTGEVIASHKYDLLGSGYKKRNWVLMANAFDGSMVRNALSYRVGKLVGMDFCPGWKFVDLVINEEYRGTYMVSDHLEAGKNRINVDEDTGWYIEANGQSVMAEEPYTSGGGLTLSIKNPEPATEAETATLKSAVSTFFTDLSAKFSASNSADPTTGWRSMADEESLLAFWLGVNISANYDGFMTVKMFRDVDDPRIHFGPLWDHDLAWGNYTDNLGHRIEEGDNGNFNQIVRKAWEDPLFVKKLHAKWHQLVNAGLKQDLLDYVDMLHSTIEQSEVLNHQKWTTYQAGFEDSGLKTHDETIAFLKNFIDKHIDGIQDQIDAQYEALKNQMPEDGPEDEPDDTPVGDLGALVDLGNGKYSYTGSASTFKEGTVITITTSENTSLSNYITEGNAWNTSKTITLTAADVTALAANSYTFYMNATGGEVKAVTVTEPVQVATGLSEGEECTYNGNKGILYTYVGDSKCMAEGAKFNITLEGNTPYYTTYTSSNSQLWFEWGTGVKDYSYTITEAQATALKNNGYKLNIVVYNGTISKASFVAQSSGSGTKTHTLTLNATEGGTVSGGGTYAEGTTVLIKAIPNEGYKFVKWSDDNTYASRSVTLKEAITLTATFAAEGSADEDPFNEQGTRKQLTDLPTIYLDATTINGEWLQAAVEVFDKDNKLYQGEAWKKEGVSKKGNINVSVQYQGSGADNSKNSYRLKFNDKINLLSATGSYKQWVLLANDDDPTMLNNALAKELGDAIGMPWTPGYQFVDLYVNGTYIGTYQLTDRVKAEEGRSLVSGGNKDLDWQVRFNDNAELAEDGTQDFIAASKASGVNVIYRNPDPKDYTTDEQKETFAGIVSAMETYFKSVFEETATNTFGNISENVDKQQLINWYIAQEILGVYKGFSSIEAYRSITEGAADNLLHFGPLWDSEKGFGNTGLAPKSITTEMGDLETEGSYKGLMIEYSAFEKMNKIFQYLWTQDWFKSGVKTKWDAIKTTLPTTLSGTITTLKGTIAASQALNAQKWSTSLGDFGSYEDALTATNTYITNRFAYLEKKFNELAGAAHVHSYTAYIDNGDGTHSRKCPDDDAIEDGSAELHTLTVNADGKAICSVCNLVIEGTSNMGTTDEKVYMLNAGTSKVQYITKTSGFTPTANTLYPINEKPEEGTVFNNVYWYHGVDEDNKPIYRADNIIVTDGTAWLGDVKVSAKNATYERTMSASSVWGTVCLPFKTEKNDDVTLYQLTSSTADLSGNGNMVFIEANSTGGLTPLVFKKNNATATNVSFKCSAQDDGYVTVKAAKNMSSNNTGNSTAANWELIGNVKGTQTLNTTADAIPALYAISSNKFWHATGTLNVTPFRAYFSYTPTTPVDASTLAKVFSIGISDNQATSIEGMKEKPLAIFIDKGSISLASDKKTVVKIHNISGSLITNTLVGAGECKTISLPAGLYIVNGTKVTVK